jgi:hypothetical protein
MLHHSTLPSRRNALPLGAALPGSHSFGYKQSSLFNFLPSGILSRPQSCSPEAVKPAETKLGHNGDDVESCEESRSKVTAVDAEEGDVFEHDPADSDTWGARSLPNWQRSAILPGSGKDDFHTR